MARYMVLWTANSNAWPTDAQGILGVTQMSAAGGDMLIASGSVKDLAWFTAQSGYGIFEADSKATVLGAVQAFYPFYDADIREIVEWEAGKQAILGTAQQVADSAPAQSFTSGEPMQE